MNSRINKKEMFGYGVADAGQALIGTLIGFYQVYFFTDVMLLPALSLAGVFLVTKILDCVSFPLFGFVIDRYSHRLGGYRSWLAYMIVPFFLVSIAMFSFNKGWSEGGRIAYAYCIVSLFFVVSATISVSYSGLVSSITGSSRERANLSTVRFGFAFGASTLAMLSTSYLVDLFGGKENNGFFEVAIIFSIISALFLYITYATTAERIPARINKNLNWWREVKGLFREPIFLSAFFSSLFIGVFVAVKSQLTLFYINNVMQKPEVAGLLMASGSVACAVGVGIVGLFINKINRKSLFVSLMGLNSAFIAAIYFVNPENLYWVILFHCLNSLVGGACAPVLFSIYSDVVDYYDEIRDSRSPGLVNSCAILSGRLGGSLGLFLVPLGLAFYNYRPSDTPDPSASAGIVVMFTLVPAFFALLAALVMCFYPLSNRDSEAIAARLVNRNAVLSNA